jgi:hypothetical protein
MIKLYRKSQAAQYTWMRNHPVQYVALNATLLAAFYAYTVYKDRQEMRKTENELAN